MSFQTRISIKTNANKELHTIQAPTNDDEFQKLFRVSHRRGNKAKKIQSQSWIIFRTSTDMTLATIRKEQTVHDALQRSHGNLVYYPWTEDVHDVVSLGFFVGPLPKYMTSTQFEEELIPLISAKAKIDAKRIPKHRCGHAQLEAPQEPQIPNPAIPRHSSWAALAAGTITALPPTQPETASNKSYTEAQVQALLASQDQRLEQRLKQRLAERLAHHDHQLNQMITMLQKLIISMCSPPQDTLQPPSQTVPSPMRKQRRTEPTVTLRQDYAMSDADMTNEDQSQDRASQRLDPTTKEALHPTVHATAGTKLSQPPLPP
ncbi:hypothetical protein IV203_027046 [Nitzschia inconspicua]|uniref:Uncharacterized protein n=1 Tax=Nitzschia inconspicua TaxID=303405 RepID=A0A9K3PY78_9STRA|nr:hypothetical protein IV203_027046 [Nitzschia inconspicua]